MTHEGGQPNPLDLVIGKYNYDPYLWGFSFVEGAIREAAESEQEFPPFFTGRIIDETYELICDTLVEHEFPNTNPFLRLRRAGRIAPQDCRDINLMSDFQMSEFAKFYSSHAKRKISALAEYLTRQGYVEAIPLSFLAGTAEQTLMEDASQEVDGEDYDAESRNAVHMRAWRIFQQGGTIYFPTWEGDSRKAPFALQLGPRGEIKSLDPVKRNQITIDNRIKHHLEYDNANGVILAMLKKPFVKRDR